VLSGGRRSAEPTVALIVVLLIASIGIGVQQTIFYRFVQEAGGRPDELFKSETGDHYRLWSLTVPFWSTSVAMLIVALGWAVRFRRLKHRQLIIAMWFGYVIILWFLIAASSGLIEILGKGEVSI
jgi:phosphoglycerol transferase MdoB-like AlkP superfamily enzyme